MAKSRERKLERSTSGSDTGPAPMPAPSPSRKDRIAARHFDGQVVLRMRVRTGPKFDYRDPFTFARLGQAGSANGSDLSRGEDYSEGQQHGLYLMDGKLRLHVTFRWTDLAMRVETADPLAARRMEHVAVSYDGGMKAAGVRMYVNGEPQS